MPIADFAGGAMGRSRGLATRLTCRLSLSGLLTLLLCAASYASAGQGRSQPADSGAAALPESILVRPDMAIEGELSESDPRNEEGAPFDDYRLHLEAGDTVQIELNADRRPDPASPGADSEFSFDAYLEVFGPEGGLPLAANDDRPSTLNSGLVFAAPQRGEYVLRARPLITGVGRYELNISRVATQSPPSPFSERRASGILDASSAVSTLDPAFRYAQHWFNGRAGERIQLTYRSEVPAASLQLTGPDGRTIATEQAAEMADPNNAMLVAVLARPGRHILRVEAKVEQRPAHYEIGLVRDRSTRVVWRRRIGENSSVDWYLSAQSPVQLVPNSQEVEFFYRIFLMTVRRGETVRIDLISEDFDGVLDVGAMGARGFAAEMTDDNGGGGTNSRIILQPERSETVAIRVRSYRRMGRFRLITTRADPLAGRPGS